MLLNGKLKELDAERAQLAAELEAAPEEKQLIHPAMAITYRQSVVALAQALYGQEFGRQAFERLRAVVKAAVLSPVNGHLAIELRAGAEGQAYALNMKNVAQIKLVAGACNHLDLQLQELLQTCCGPCR